MGSQVEVHNMVQESKKNGIIHVCSEDFFNIGWNFTFVVKCCVLI